jgi:hypothetical protein
MLLTQLQAVMQHIGKDTLGFKAMEMGTNSLCLGAAMAMQLAGVPVYTIMLIGRWSSDAFLQYIWKQVQAFSIGISNHMIASPEFFTIPNTVSPNDPFVLGHLNNLAARSNIGPDAQQWAHLPASTLYH